MIVYVSCILRGDKYIEIPALILHRFQICYARMHIDIYRFHILINIETRRFICVLMKYARMMITVFPVLR